MNRGFAESRARGARAGARRGRVLPRLPPVRRAVRSSASTRPKRRSRTSSTSPGPPPTTGASSPSRSVVPCTRGLLANDVVSFHTPRWRRNFLRCCDDILGRRGRLRGGRGPSGRARGLRARRARSRSTPRSSTTSPRARASLKAEEEIVRERTEHLVLRVDRTDPSKNVVRGFRAYELYLEAHPEMHGRVQMLALLDPSRQEIPEYAEYLGAIQRAARVVNDRFRAGELGADRPAGPGRLSPGRRRVQAVRRPSRQRHLRRHEPRRQGGAAREHAGRRPTPLRERRRPRRARRLGA